MSVINQMLLDLEARAKARAKDPEAAEPDTRQETAEDEAVPPTEVRAIPAPKSAQRRQAWQLGLLAVGAMLVAAWIGLQYWPQHKPAGPAPEDQLSLRLAETLEPMQEVPDAQTGEQGDSAGMEANPPAAAGMDSAALPGAYPPAVAAPDGVPPVATPGNAALPPGPGRYPPAVPAPGNYPPAVSAPGNYPPPVSPPRGYPPTNSAPGTYPPAVPAPGHYPPAVAAGKLQLDVPNPAPRRDSARAEPVAEPAPPPELTPRQQAEAEHRRGQELARAGKGAEAIAHFERALQLDRGFGAARISLANSLAEAKRVEEAMTRLQEGLDENRTNASLAMALARLQIDRGDTRGAIDTLGRTLPHDRDRPDYQAFMAGLLQKEGRNKEAIDYYLNALRRTPQNAAWWLGLGLSLQAEKRVPEAREALQRAMALGGLSSDQKATVQQRLEQMR